MSKGENAAKPGSGQVGFQPTTKGKDAIPAPQDAEFNAYILRDVLMELASTNPTVNMSEMYAAYQAKIARTLEASPKPVPFKVGQWVRRGRGETAVGFGFVVETVYDSGVTIQHPDGSTSECTLEELELISASDGSVVKNSLKPGMKIPATYESHQFLPVGTLVTLTDCTEHPGYWNNRCYVKTSDNTWAAVNGSTTPAQQLRTARNAVQRHSNNLSPCPPGHGGNWLILAEVEAD